MFITLTEMNVAQKMFCPHSKRCCITFQKKRKAEDRNSVLKVLNCKIEFSKLFLRQSHYYMMCWWILFVEQSGGLILWSFWSFSHKRQRKMTCQQILASWPSCASSASSPLLWRWFSLWNSSSRRGPILRGSKMMCRWWVFKLLLNQEHFLLVRWAK